jgi:cyclophilin family peptidyl-prolyl cis-trans isomerase
MKKLIIVAALAAFPLAACAPHATTAPVATGPSAVVQAPDSFLVTITTTKGDVIAKAHRDWSPLAVDRFYQLVSNNIWKDVRIFRVVPGFVAQWGLTGDSAVDNLWRNARVPDEPVKASNRRGTLSFARGGPQSRTIQVFINLVNNARLDDMAAGGVAGYPPIAEIIQGMDVVDKWESKYGEQPGALQGVISSRGWGPIDQQFPGLDRILKTTVTKKWKK